jgi:hypothetical protein
MLIKTTFKRRLNYKTLEETKTVKRLRFFVKRRLTTFKRHILAFKRCIA